MAQLFRVVFILTTASILAACASTRYSSKTAGVFGADVEHNEVQAGFHRIITRTGVAPWPNHSATRRAWTHAATELCGEGKYREFSVQELAIDQIPPLALLLRYIVTEKRGFILCSDSEMPEEAAAAYANARRVAQ